MIFLKQLFAHFEIANIHTFINFLFFVKLASPIPADPNESNIFYFLKQTELI